MMIMCTEVHLYAAQLAEPMVDAEGEAHRPDDAALLRRRLVQGRVLGAQFVHLHIFGNDGMDDHEKQREAYGNL